MGNIWNKGLTRTTKGLVSGVILRKMVKKPKVFTKMGGKWSGEFWVNVIVGSGRWCDGAARQSRWSGAF